MKTKVYEEQFAESAESLESYADFVAVVKQLRRDCPWDREQTHESVKHLLIEEAYEALEAIEDKDWEELRKELGDVFLHVVFHSVMAQQGGRFTLKDVIDGETEKLIRRHPHVFSDAEVTDTDQVLRNWEQIKLEEAEDEGEVRSVLEGVPRHLPSLLRAFRMQEKAAGVGFDFPNRDGAWGKVEEEVEEFHTLVEEGGSDERREEEFGDMLFALVNYARLAGINPENALQRTNGKFVRRFQHVEQRLRDEKRSFDDADLQTMDAFWDEAKTLEEDK